MGLHRDVQISALDQCGGRQEAMKVTLAPCRSHSDCSGNRQPLKSGFIGDAGPRTPPTDTRVPRDQKLRHYTGVEIPVPDLPPNVPDSSLPSQTTCSLSPRRLSSILLRLSSSQASRWLSVHSVYWPHWVSWPLSVRTHHGASRGQNSPCPAVWAAKLVQL